jgi:hypothetical protein
VNRDPCPELSYICLLFISLRFPLGLLENYILGELQLTRRIGAQHINSTQLKSHLPSSPHITANPRSCTTIGRMTAWEGILLCPIRNSFPVFEKYAFVLPWYPKIIHIIGSFLHSCTLQSFGRFWFNEMNWRQWHWYWLNAFTFHLWYDIRWQQTSKWDLSFIRIWWFGLSSENWYFSWHLNIELLGLLSSISDARKKERFKLTVLLNFFHAPFEFGTWSMRP